MGDILDHTQNNAGLALPSHVKLALRTVGGAAFAGRSGYVLEAANVWRPLDAWRVGRAPEDARARADASTRVADERPPVARLCAGQQFGTSLEGRSAAELDGYDELLGLKDTRYATLCACAVGFRSDDDKHSNAPKVRYKLDEVIERR